MGFPRMKTPVAIEFREFHPDRCLAPVSFEYPNP